MASAMAELLEHYIHILTEFDNIFNEKGKAEAIVSGTKENMNLKMNLKEL